MSDRRTELEIKREKLKQLREMKEQRAREQRESRSILSDSLNLTIRNTSASVSPGRTTGNSSSLINKNNNNISFYDPSTTNISIDILSGNRTTASGTNLRTDTSDYDDILEAVGLKSGKLT